MISKIGNQHINYIHYGEKEKPTIVFLHGWGQNIDMMKPLADAFQKDFGILIIDLPGHGQSEEPENVWSIYDFSECIKSLLSELNILNPILVGHSFGGKISLAYASKYSTSKLILLGSPIKKGIEKLSLKTKMLKQLKKVPGINQFEELAKKHIGSTDYKNASPKMREILVEHVNLDIRESLKKIECSALIIWGSEDTDVPLEQAYELESLLKDAGVVVFEGCTHYAYLENLKQTIRVIGSFIRS